MTPVRKPPTFITIAFGPGERDAVVLSLCADRKWTREVHVYRIVEAPKQAKKKPAKAKKAGRGR